MMDGDTVGGRECAYFIFLPVSGGLVGDTSYCVPKDILTNGAFNSINLQKGSGSQPVHYNLNQQIINVLTFALLY